MQARFAVQVLALEAQVLRGVPVYRCAFPQAAAPGRRGAAPDGVAVAVGHTVRQAVQFRVVPEDIRVLTVAVDACQRFIAVVGVEFLRAAAQRVVAVLGPGVFRVALNSDLADTVFVVVAEALRHSPVRVVAHGHTPEAVVLPAHAIQAFQQVVPHRLQFRRGAVVRGVIQAM